MSVKEAIALTFAYYNPGKALDDAVLLMYAEDLGDLNPADVLAAYAVYRRNPKNRAFPLPAQIREVILPQDYISAEQKAAEIAGRICGAVPKFGWCNGKDAEAFIGPIGWQIVQRQGGWTHLCENLGTNINPSAFQAQVRQQLSTNLHYGPDVVEESIGALPSTRGGELTSAGDVLKFLSKKNPDAS